MLNKRARSTGGRNPINLFGRFFVCGKGGNEVFLLFFLLWLLLSGGVSLHACLWGLAVSALLTWFCRRVLGYDWRIFCGRPARIWALIRYFAHLVAEMLKAGLMVMKIIYVHPKKITPKLVWFRTPCRRTGTRRCCRIPSH